MPVLIPLPCLWLLKNILSRFCNFFNGMISLISATLVWLILEAFNVIANEKNKENKKLKSGIFSLFLFYMIQACVYLFKCLGTQTWLSSGCFGIYHS